MCTMLVIMHFMIRIKFTGYVKDGILISLSSAALKLIIYHQLINIHDKFQEKKL